MRFLIIVKATADSEAGGMPGEARLAEMARYHGELVKAGVLLDAAGLRPSAAGWRVRYAAGRRGVREGPFANPQELIAGYTLIQVKTREEAEEWARRFPNPAGEGREAEIEVRPLFEPEDFESDGAVERFRSPAGEPGAGGRP